MTQPVRCCRLSVSRDSRRLNSVEISHLAMIAMDQQGMIPTIQDDAQDRLHCRDRDALLLRPLHVEYGMPDAIAPEELVITLGKVLLDEGATPRLVRRKAGDMQSLMTSHLHDRLQLQVRYELVVLRPRKTTPVHARDYDTEVDRPAGGWQAPLGLGHRGRQLLGGGRRMECVATDVLITAAAPTDAQKKGIERNVMRLLLTIGRPNQRRRL